MVIEPASEWNTLELYVIPGEGCTELHVSSLVFELTVDETSVTCQIPLSVRGPRLNTTKKQVGLISDLEFARSYMDNFDGSW